MTPATRKIVLNALYEHQNSIFARSRATNKRLNNAYLQSVKAAIKEVKGTRKGFWALLLGR